ncbi:MAG: amidohydrolase family protein [Candidatus Bathyarchaeota archaeon]|nr:amidohydrolase family protein [Candidatus Bathyarchaeota archaeon]
MVDYLIKGGLIYTMDRGRHVIEDGAVMVENDHIVAVGKSTEIERSYEAETVIEAAGKAVLPGFVNVHTHLPSIFVRGVYGVVREGLYQVLFPVKEYLKPEHCYVLGLASCAEALTSGSTTIQETYNYMDMFARAAEESGIRADLGEQIAEADYQAIKDGVYEYRSEQAEEMIKRAKSLKDKWDGAADGRLTVSWAPLAPDMCTPWVYEEVMKLHKPGEKVSTHVEQSRREVDQVRKLYGKTSVEHLKDMGVLGPDLIGAHCIFNSDKDLRLMKEADASVLHCPRPYLLGGATAPLARWIGMGIKVGLGTDNVNHTMWETMRAALYGARHRETLGELGSPSYYEVLELATIKGAEVMGVSDKVGSLEPGKKADLQLIDLKCPHIMPTADVTSSLVLYGGTVNVDTVMVNGRIVKQNGEITIMDVGKVLDEAQEITDEIWSGLFSDRPELRKLVKG